MTVRQYLLPDYPYEPALLRALAADLATRPRLVTYNGRAFDLPMLAARLTVHGLFREQATLPDAHDDLLPDARRLFRRPLGGARLADVESGVLGVSARPTARAARSRALLRLPARRVAGHPGRGPRPQLPGRRQPRPAGGRAVPAARRRLARRPGPRPRGMALELLRAGRRRRGARARRGGPGDDADPAEANALRRVASRLLIALGQVERAEELWTIGTRRASIDAATAWIEVARIRERHRGDLRGAMEAAATASRVLDIAFALGRGGSIAEVGRTRIRVERRLRRLRRWVAAAERRAARCARRAAAPAPLGSTSSIRMTASVRRLRDPDGRAPGELDGRAAPNMSPAPTIGTPSTTPRNRA